MKCRKGGSGLDKYIVTLNNMRSRIKIDLDTSGKAHIRIDYQCTDDLRDRLVGRFISKMGIPEKRNGFWAYCRLGHETQSKVNGVYDGVVVVIEPMDEDILSTHLKEIEYALSEHAGEILTDDNI